MEVIYKENCTSKYFFIQIGVNQEQMKICSLKNVKNTQLHCSKEGEWGRGCLRPTYNSEEIF